MSDSVKCPLCHETFTDVDALALHQQRQVECLKHRLAEERERGDDAEAKNRRVLDAWLRERGRAEKAEAAFQHTWTCGCGWRNGVNLATCAQCNRTPDQHSVQDEPGSAFLDRLKAAEANAELACAENQNIGERLAMMEECCCKAEAERDRLREVVERLLSVGKRAVSRPQDGEVVRDWLRAADAAKDLNPDPLPMRPTGQRRIVTQSKGA
jgi:hypothetical protein